jgi:hypothetical protein
MIGFTLYKQGEEVIVMADIQELADKLKTDDRIEFDMHALNLVKKAGTTVDLKGIEHIIQVARDGGRPAEIRISAMKAIREAGTLTPGVIDQLTDIVYDKKQPLELRWATADVLEYLNPGMAAMFSHDRDLNTRPGKVQQAQTQNVHEIVNEIAEKENKRIPLFFAIPLGLLAVGIVSALLYGTPAFIPFIVAASVAVAGIITWLAALSTRCPACRRYFAKSGRVLESSYEQTMDYVVDSSPSSLASARSTRRTVKVYRVTCRHCGHAWRVL